LWSKVSVAAVVEGSCRRLVLLVFWNAKNDDKKNDSHQLNRESLIRPLTNFLGEIALPCNTSVAFGKSFTSTPSIAIYPRSRQYCRASQPTVYTASVE
jgi:hypothetical protein